MNWEELWQRFSERGRLRPRTLDFYLKHVRSFRAFFPGLELRNVQTKHLRDFFAAELERKGRGSAARKTRSVCVLLRWAHRQDLLLHDPCDGFVVPKVAAALMPILSLAQVNQLLEAPLSARRRFVRARDVAILEVLYGCGLRGGELLGLQLGDIDLAGELLTIRQSKGRPRQVPMGRRAAQALERYLLDFRPVLAARGETAVWLDFSGKKPLNSSGLGTMLRRYGKKLGIDGLSAHALRRACATHLLEHGANIVDIKTLLGHADINSTLHYAKVFPVELRKAHQHHHPRARLNHGRR